MQTRKFGGYARRVMSGRQQLPTEVVEEVVRIVQGKQ
jgi:hypothetical protein